MAHFTPKETVAELDRYIIGQDKAKRAVAVALRNRYRRAHLPDDFRDEVIPKNILMVGPTGVGKTEIARRLAKLTDAPFVKVEATKFTEVGYVGRDVDSIVRDLVESAIRIEKQNRMATVQEEAARRAEDQLVQLLVSPSKKPSNPIDLLLGNKPKEPTLPPEEQEKRTRDKNMIREQLRAGELEERMVELEVAESMPGSEIPGTDMKMQDVLGSILPPRKKMRSMSVAAARKILEQEEATALIDMDDVYNVAIMRAEQEGIVFLDEMDKIASSSKGQGPDVSREGVQRDILPIVEGCTVSTKYGPVKTDHMLFIGSGAFHVAKVSDLIPELQGRFPVRVELLPLTQEDFRNILTKPDNAIIKQYTALLGVDGVTLDFADSAIDAISEVAFRVNENSENIGARRLHTVLESLLEDVSFEASGQSNVELLVDDAYVKEHLHGLFSDKDLKKFIL